MPVLLIMVMVMAVTMGTGVLFVIMLEKYIHGHIVL